MLRDQLSVSEEEFWKCVRDGVPPNRGVYEPSAEALPADVVYMLINRLGLAQTDVARMTKDEAVARLQRFWTTGE